MIEKLQSGRWLAKRVRGAVWGIRVFDTEDEAREWVES